MPVDGVERHAKACMRMLVHVSQSRFKMKNLVDGNANDRYYAVFYSKDGSIHLWPGSTQKECLEVLREVASSPKWGPRCLRTTVIKRDMSHCKDGFVFGSPKSLNVAGGSR